MDEPTIWQTPEQRQQQIARENRFALLMLGIAVGVVAAGAVAIDRRFRKR